MYYKLHAYKKAIQLYQSISTNDALLKAKYLHNIANAYIQLGRWQKAKTYLEKSLSAHPFKESKHNLQEVKKMLHKIKTQKRKGKKEEKIIFKAITPTNTYKKRSSKYTITLKPLSATQEEQWLQKLQKEKTPLFIQKIPTSKRSLDAESDY